MITAEWEKMQKKRDLHIEKALAVTNRVPIIKDKSSYPHFADCAALGNDAGMIGAASLL